MGIAWPAALPQMPLRENYSYQNQDGRIATDMQQGPPRFRRMYANTPRVYTVTFTMTKAQLQAFETLWNGVLQGGAVAVDLPVLDAGGRAVREVFISSMDPVRGNGGFDWIVKMKAISTT